MMWPFKSSAQPAPAEKDEAGTQERSETIRARAAKRTAAAGLLEALRGIEIERDLSDALAKGKKI